MNLNKAMIIGNLTRDPEVRTLPSGQSLTNFGVATNLVWTDASGERQEKVEYHNIVAWRKLGEICAQYLKKGKKVYIEGRLQTRSWEDQSGVKKYKTEIVAENMIMLDSGRQEGGRQEGGIISEESKVKVETLTPEENETEEVNVEEIPF